LKIITTFALFHDVGIRLSDSVQLSKCLRNGIVPCFNGSMFIWSIPDAV